MRFLLSFLLIALLSFIAGLFGPWWLIAVVAFLVILLLPQTAGKSFLAGFLAIFLLWSLLALIIDLKNDSYLSAQVAQLFGLGPASILLVLITGLLGGIVSGLAAMTSAFLQPVKRRI
jgi:hypothetical protein